MRVNPSRFESAHGGSLEELYRRSFARMVSLAWLVTGSKVEAEQIVQDAFLGVAQRWQRIDNPDAYLRTCVVNGCKRKSRRDPELPAAAASDPALELPAHEIDETLLAVGKLGRRTQTVLVLRYYEDMSVKDIASIMGCPEPTVRSLVRRGLVQLSEALSDGRH